jgi:S1-C subfamily serine protease
MNPLKIAAISLLMLGSIGAQQAPEATAVIEKTKSGTAIILTGQGAGRLQSVATGVIVASDGVLLTALHAIKGATEVQVRLPNGETFDRVELIGSDERRDVAALRISARGLPALKPSAGSVVQGEGVIALTNAGGLTWSATQGIVSATRPADEVPGAGTGFRLIQFDAAVAPGSSGGALVNRAGELVGIITRGTAGTGFAVPVESVLGLRESTQKLVLGSGSALKMPVTVATELSQSQAALEGFDPKRLCSRPRRYTSALGQPSLLSRP